MVYRAKVADRIGNENNLKIYYLKFWKRNQPNQKTLKFLLYKDRFQIKIILGFNSKLNYK